jgi:N-acetylneuraminic acid mutarotase
MSFLSVAVRFALSLGTRYSALLFIPLGLLLPATGLSQVNYTGSGAVNFGSQSVGSPSASKTLTFSFSSSTTIGGTQVVTQGATGLDFTDAGAGTCTSATTYGAGDTCTVIVTFKPTLPWARYGAAELLDASRNVLATGYVQGSGVGPQMNFLPGTQKNVPGTSPEPTGLAVDASGSVYSADPEDKEVLKSTLSAGGYTFSVVSSGTIQPSGVAVDGSGSVYISGYLYSGGVVTQIGEVLKATPTASGGYTESVIASGLENLYGIAVDGSGNVYVVNTQFSNGHNQSDVLKFTPTGSGYTQSVIASDFGFSLGLAVDGSGNVYGSGSDSTGPIISKLTLSAGSYVQSTVATFVGQIISIAVDGSGNVYGVDNINNKVYKETPSEGGYTESVFLANGELPAPNIPLSVAVDSSGSVYIGFAWNAAFDLGPVSALKEDFSEPPSLSFATTNAGLRSTDSPKTVQVSNIGNEALVFSDLSYPPDFPEAAGDPNPCTGSASLNPAQSCDLPIDFIPRSGTALIEKVTLTNNSLNEVGSSQSIVVSGNGTGLAASAALFSVTAAGSVMAGSPFTVTVTALDAAGNRVTAYTGSVAFTSSDSLFVSPGTLALSAGIGQTTLTLKRSGTQTVTATDTINSALMGSETFQVAPSAAVSLVITVPQLATAGTAFPFTVAAYDIYGNQATGYSGTVGFSSSDRRATLPGESTLIAGKSIFPATLRTAGQESIAATDNANHLSITSTDITVSLHSGPTIALDEWTWMGGSSTIGSNCTPNQEGANCGRPGVYNGKIGVPFPGNNPGARSGAASWTDRSGNFWLLGGTGFDGNGTYGSLDDLWEFHPSLNEWAWMGGSSTVPAEFGGWPGVYGTLGTAAAANMPGSRTGASTWTDDRGNLWLFGGFGFDATSSQGYLDDLWEFEHSLKQWVWMGGSSTIGSNGGQLGVYGALGTPAAGNMPGSRTGASSWTDTRGHLWLFGGASFSGNQFFYSAWYLNDLWEFFPDLNEWAWMGGDNYNNPAGFTASASCNEYDGCGWNGVYGSLQMPALGNNPGSRSDASSWADSKGNLWLFGGSGFDSTVNSFGALNDLWEFNPTTDEWTWMGGSNTVPYHFGGQPGVYGTLGSPSSANIPGGRSSASSWTDRVGHFWLYGGGGYANETSGELNDLWMFDPSTDEWVWMSGSDTAVCLPQDNGNCGRPGVYGTLGTPAAGNVPGGRLGAASWIDNTGNLWLFGGVGYDSIGNTNGAPDSLNDLWEYEPPHHCDHDIDTRHRCDDEHAPRRDHRQGSQDLDN